MSVEVTPVETRAERKAFVRFPWQIYPGRYPWWVPPLLSEERKRIDPGSNPFFEHGSVQLLLARRDGRIVGRIAAIENELHNKFHNEKLGFFGFFESIDDREVASALLDSAAAWVKARGLEVLRGPANFSTNEECGLLVENFDDPPFVLMTYNPPYYEILLEGWGLTRAKDLLAYHIVKEEFDMRRFSRLERLSRRSGHEIRVRSLDMRRFDEEIRLIRDLYNAAWERNWGFVPMTDEEVEHMAKQLKPVLDPNLALIGEIDGKPVGFALALPDVNQAIRHANGRLFPVGIFKLLWHMRRIDRIRIITLGILEEYRRIGLDAMLYFEIFKRGSARGAIAAESSWILEDNVLMRRALEKIGFRQYKTYRLYERALQ